MPLESVKDATTVMKVNPLELEWETRMGILVAFFLVSFLLLGYVYRLSRQAEAMKGMESKKLE